MILHKRVLLCSVATAALAAMIQPLAAAPWQRGFVVATYEYAFRYGGRAGFERAGDIEPGSDCLHGNTVHFANDKNTEAAIRQPFRSKYEIAAIARPPGLDQVRAPVETRFQIWNRAITYRAWKRGIETYVNPWAAEDPGQPEVTGRIATGLNLDNNPNTGDFVAEDGEKGIDFALYKAWGCDAPWRGNGNATLHLRANDKMQGGLYTVVIRVSGNKDPMNDDNATLEIGYSPDKITKNARGDVAADYSYRIVKTEQYTKLKAKIRNGVVETEQVAELHAPRLAWFYDHAGDADLRKGKIRLSIGADGNAKGLIGGYRNWRELYTENTFAQDGGQQGIREHEDHVALYYALKRNADGMPDPRTGEKMGISSTYRITAMPAYIVDPETPASVTVIAAEERRKNAFLAIRAALIKSTLTKVVQGVPPGTSQGAFPALERNVDGLPSKDFFLTVLDRPHYDKDIEAAILKRGRGAIFDDPLDQPKPKPEPSPAPDKQVRNEAAPAQVADAGKR
ncbi:MAG: hypothetical protein RL274_2834 [Pseudomonadota bacterium]|jgi:hypothetical protein